jgi:hypothetical protein
MKFYEFGDIKINLELVEEVALEANCMIFYMQSGKRESIAYESIDQAEKDFRNISTFCKLF